MSRRVIGSIGIGILVPLGFWVGGYDFDRGSTAATLFILCLLVFGASFTCPYWED